MIEQFSLFLYDCLMSTNPSDQNTPASLASKKPQRKRKRQRKRPSSQRMLILMIAAAIAVVALGYGTYTLCHALFSPKTVNQAPAVGSTEKKKDRTSSSTKSESSSEITSQSASVQVSLSDEEAYAAMRSMRDTIDKAYVDDQLVDLGEQIRAYLSEHNIDQSKISWAVQDLTTEAIVESDNAKEDFTAASTYKLPLCMYYYEQIAEGKIDPNQKLLYSEEMREEEDKENLGQPIHRKYQVGDEIQIDELLEAALLYSDNIAGHMLYENLGGWQAFKTIVARYSPYEQSENFYKTNVLSSDYMMRLLAIIYNTPGTFNDLKYWLQNASIDTYLNRNMSGHYIQKIGNINEVRNAGGISNGSAPFTLSIYSCIDKHQGQDVIADLAVLVNDYFVNKYNSGFYQGEKADLIAMLNAQMSTPTDVIVLRPGPKGQEFKPLTEEEEAQLNAAIEE